MWFCTVNLNKLTFHLFKSTACVIIALYGR
nr:MAG TPA: hypothetical protein [Caudoviricetes sp.]